MPPARAGSMVMVPPSDRIKSRGFIAASAALASYSAAIRRSSSADGSGGLAGISPGR
jgi:hypothetical protein